MPPTTVPALSDDATATLKAAAANMVGGACGIGLGAAGGAALALADGSPVSWWLRGASYLAAPERGIASVPLIFLHIGLPVLLVGGVIWATVTRRLGSPYKLGLWLAIFTAAGGFHGFDTAGKLAVLAVGGLLLSLAMVAGALPGTLMLLKALFQGDATSTADAIIREYKAEAASKGACFAEDWELEARGVVDEF